MKVGNVGNVDKLVIYREQVCTNPAACNWCMSKTHFRATCPTATRIPPAVALPVPIVATPVASINVKRGLVVVEV